MQGLEISRLYYEKYGRDMIHTLFPEYENKIAVGIAGPGSDCFGFDDEISRDHDFGAGFCMWVDDAVYDKIGFALTRAYTALPGEIEGIPKYRVRPYGVDRFGVIKIKDFFTPLTGSGGAPASDEQWLSIPDCYLACAVNGEVFRDDSGEFTAEREKLLNMPADVRLKKMSVLAINMAQSGQYNFRRCIEHGENGAAALALAEFVRNAVSLCYTAEGRYCPFYKWAFRGLKSLDKFSGIGGRLENLITVRTDSSLSDEIESVCAVFAGYFREEGLSSHKDNFLEPHAYEIREKIKNPSIRNMHIMEG